MLFDTHCHLSDPPLHARLPEVLHEASAQGVSRILAPATRPADWDAVLALPRAAAPMPVFPALGIHPWFAAEADAAALARLDGLLAQQPQTLVGEIGLDFYPPRRRPDAVQLAAFQAQLALARKHRRPVVIHCLKAGAECLAAVKQAGLNRGGLMHAFSGSPQEAACWIAQGFKIGIGSLLLKPQARKIRQVVASLALQDMVLETDAPYMSPAAGVPNHPARTRQVAEAVATLKHTDWRSVAHITTANALQLIGATA